MKLHIIAVLAGSIGVASAAQAAPVPPALSEIAAATGAQIEHAKWKRGGGGYGRGNRGRHLGWYRGRGNPHRYGRF